MADNLPHRAPPTPPMVAADWDDAFSQRIRASFPELVFKSYLNQHWIECVPDAAPTVLQHLRDSERFDMLTDLTAVDHPNDPERFEIVYLLYSFASNERVRVKTRTANEIPSVVTIYSAANWLEREVYDMFGVQFGGHPGLKRILMPEDWAGFPLRKEKSIVDMDDDWVQRNLGIESGQ